MAFRKKQLALLVTLAIQQFSNAAFAQTASTATDANLPEVKVKSSRELPQTYNPPPATSATQIEEPRPYNNDAGPLMTSTCSILDRSRKYNASSRMPLMN